MKNEYFNLVKIHDNPSDFEILTCIKKYDDRDIWHEICKQFLNTKEWSEQSNNDPYSFIYHIDLKNILLVVAPDILDKIKPFLIEHNIDLTQDDICIYLGTSNDYANFDEKFKNEKMFLEYMNSECSEMDKHRNITEKILENAGFENITKDWERDYYKKELYIDDYSSWRKYTDDVDGNSNYIKLDICKGFTNRNTEWNLHIDNNLCQTIGSADIDTVWEFNTLMQVFKSKFRL